MVKKSDPHIFGGMQKDKSISKHEPELLYDAHNIRFTARENETLFSMTNERGTLSLDWSTIRGNYVGHCIINDTVIVFTTLNDYEESSLKKDLIYKINIDNSDNPTIEQLYFGDLRFDCNHPIECLGVYENENIQKVYWTDGVKQPRVININHVRYDNNYIDGDYNSKADTQFDFIPTLDLKENITITRDTGGGMFAPGVIQYAFAYYNKYGQESNIFYTSPLKYISFADRGGSPEDRIANTFSITIENYQSDFDYLRVFSIHRTSINAVPTVKRIFDIELKNHTSDVITVLDNGEIGDIVDPTELLYIGGEDIIAQTLTQKDNTLFLGNLSLVRHAIHDSVKNSLRMEGASDIHQAEEGTSVHIVRDLEYYYPKDTPSLKSFYFNVPTFDISPGFKVGEHYRLGLQFQHESGKWSEPVYLKDFIGGTSYIDYPNVNIDNNDISLTSSYINIYTQFSNDVYSKLIEGGYKRVRGVCVFPSFNDRLVLTQGMLCPTVYNKSGRIKNIPFAQSSWFLRPSIPSSTQQTDPMSDNGNYNEFGNYATFHHLRQIPRGRASVTPSASVMRDAELEGYAGNDTEFYIDQNILTMHSPDIEFDDSFDFYDANDYKLHLVGIINFTGQVSDIDIQTSSPANNGYKGFDKHITSVMNYFDSTNPKTDAGRYLITGGFWNDGILTTDGDGNYEVVKEDGVKKSTFFLVYPWQKTGSLNNDENRPSDKGTRTAVLEKKKISNLKFSACNKYLTSSTSAGANYNISKPQLFDSEQISLLRLPVVRGSHDVNYYGNIDTSLITDTEPMAIPTFESDTFDNSHGSTIWGTSQSSIRMKYKSTRHLVFALTNSGGEDTTILPRFNSEYNYIGSLSSSDIQRLTFWEPQSGGGTDPTDAYKQISIKITNRGSDTIENYLIDHYQESLGNGMLVLDGTMYSTTHQYILWRVTNIYRDTVEEQGQLVNRIVAVDVEQSRDTVGNYYRYSSEGTFSYYTSQSEGYLIDTQPPSDPTSVFTITQKIVGNSTDGYPYLFLGELVREPRETDFGGTSKEALMNNLWLPAGEPIDITEGRMTIRITEGDTWFQRYDCLKTYPFTLEDENSITEIGSFMCESRVNINGRYDRNRGQASNLVMTPVNFNLLNKVYSQLNNFFNYRILDEDYYNMNKLNNTVTWTKGKNNGELVDTWTNVTMANTLDLDGMYGKVNALRVFNNNIYCFQDDAISNILFNSRVQIPVSDGVPVEIANSGKVDDKRYLSTNLGCTNKWSICNTGSSMYFVDSVSKQLYNIGEGLTSVSANHGMSTWFKNQLMEEWNPEFDGSGWKGWRAFYDNIHRDLYLVGEDVNDGCLVYSEILGQFTSFMSYEKTPALFNINNGFYALRPYNSNYLGLYKMNAGQYNDFFGTLKPFDFTFISNADAVIDKIFTNVETEVDFKDAELDYNHRRFFDYIRAWNEYQDTGNTYINTPFIKASSHFSGAGAKKKFRIWNTDIPRAFEDGRRTFDRIRNTWTKIKLGVDNTKGDLEGLSMELHNISVQYYI